MAIRPTLGWNNRLVRRVMRHRSVTTLFPTAPTGSTWPAGTASGVARRGLATTADPGYVAVVIAPATNTELANSEFARAVPAPVAAVPEVPVARGPAAAPTRPPLDGPTRAARSSGPAHVGDVPQPLSPAPARMTAVTLPAPASPQPGQAQRTQAPQVPVPEPSAPGVDDGGDATLTDQVWRRLQAIFRRHQAPTLAEPETVAEAEASAEPEASSEAEALTEAEAPLLVPRGTEATPSASAATVAATAPPSGPVQRTPEPAAAAQTTRVPDDTAGTTVPQARRSRISEMALAPEPPVADTDARSEARGGEEVQSTPAGTAPSPLAALDRSAEPSAPPAAQQPDAAASARPPRTAMAAPVAAAAESAASETPAPPAAAEPAQIDPDGLAESLTPLEAGPMPPPAPIELAEAPARRTPLDQAEGPTRPASVQPRAQSVIEIRVPVPEATTREVAAAPAATPQMAPPLQDVWAVQRLPQPARTVSGTAAVPAADRDVQLPRSAQEPVPDQIVDVLGRVPAGRPTQSTIEIIPPRRPRPLPGVRQSRRPQQQPRPVRAQQPAATLVAEAAAPPEPALLAPETAQPTLPFARAVAAPQTLPAQTPVAQKPATPGAVPATAPRTVETEIGALPADLWELIGETPPTPQSVARKLPVESRTPASKPAPVPVAQTQPSAPGPTLQRSTISTTAQAPTRATATQQSGPVQTSTQQAPASEPAASEPGDAAEPETESTGEPEVDVDKLARRIYAEIRRRLTVEWERARRY